MTDLPPTNRPRRESDAPRASRAEPPADTGLNSLFDQVHPANAALGSRRTRRQQAPKNRMLVPILVTVALVALIIGGVGFGANALFGDQIRSWFAEPEPTDYEGEGTGEVTIQIAEGEFGEQIATTLEEAGVIMNAQSFYELLLALPEDQTGFEAGNYLMREQMSNQAALTLLNDPASRTTGILIREGETSFQAFDAIAASLGVSREQVDAAAADVASFGLPAQATSLEGFLFPATYDFMPGEEPRAILQRMVDRTKEALAAANVPEVDWYNTIVTASLIEREVRVDEDRPRVARVILNRLAAGMPLQFDSAVHYGLGDFSTTALTAEQQADASNPYNTYQHLGLPPGPISNPGEASIRAAMTPADGTWLYFVAINLDTGETRFATTLAEHEANVALLNDWLQQQQ